MTEGRISKAFFTLLRAGLWGGKIDFSGCFPLSPQEWKSLFQSAIDQTVEGLVFEGLQQLDNALKPDKGLLIQWVVRIEKTAQRNAWMNRIIAEQAEVFHKQGLKPLLLKGQGLAICYQEPERRSCGDIDWYFSSRSDYKKANSLIEGRGINVQYTPGFSTSYNWNNCEVEHHSKMLDFHSPFGTAYLRRLEDSEKTNAIQIKFSGTALLLPSPLMQTVQVNTHILKHLLSYGIGLRQLCDAARVYYTYRSQLDGELIENIYRKLRILKWIYLLHDLLTRYIGLPAECLPFATPVNVSGDWMMRDILAGGNFGFQDRSGAATKEKRDRTKIWQNAKKYFPYAPLEACSFPIVHFYSRFVR